MKLRAVEKVSCSQAQLGVLLGLQAHPAVLQLGWAGKPGSVPRIGICKISHLQEVAASGKCPAGLFQSFPAPCTSKWEVSGNCEGVNVSVWYQIQVLFNSGGWLSEGDSVQADYFYPITVES